MSEDGSVPSAPRGALRVLIVDDEPLARSRLRELLVECPWPRAEVVGEAGSAAEALHWLAQNGARAALSALGGSGAALDLVLLDIRMPGLDGLALADRLRAMSQPPAVVFVTAYPEHALRAFEVAAVDYLPKPVRRARLHDALARVAARLGVSPSAVPMPGLPAPAAPADEPFILVQERGHLMRIPASAILYLKAELKYVTVRTATASHVIDDSLTDLEPRLGPRFLRVHRNALVALPALRELQRRRDDEADERGESSDGGEAWAVRLAPVDEWLAVSRRQLQAVREALRHADG